MKDDGRTIVTFDDGTQVELTPEETIKRFEKGEPLTSPEFNSNIDKVLVKGEGKLTDDQKQAVRENIKKANPDLNLTDDKITVGDDGKATVDLGGNVIKNLIPDQTIKRYDVGDPLISPEFNDNIDKVPVKDGDKLTDDQKQKVKDNIKKANPGMELTDGDITVDDDGTTTVNTKDGSKKTLTPDQTTNRYNLVDPLINTGNADSFNKNIDKVPVEGQRDLTEQEKERIKQNIKDANPNSPIKDIDVKDDGRTIVTLDDGTQIELTPDQTVNRYEKGEPLTTPDFNDQVEKEVIKGNDKLTDDQKQKIKDNIKKANPGMELTDGDITVDDDGTTTVNTKDGSKKTLTPDQTIKRYDLSDPLFYDDTAKDRSANDDKNSDRENNSNTDNDSSKDSNSDKANNSDNHEDQSNNKNAQSINGVKDERDATISSKNDMNVKTNNKQSLLPQTGNQTSSLQTLGLAVLSLLTLSFFKKKKQD